MADVWYYFNKDNMKIVKHWENDGWAYLQNGPEATETEMTIEYFLDIHFSPDDRSHNEILKELVENSIIEKCVCPKCDCHKGYRILSTANGGQT